MSDRMSDMDALVERAMPREFPGTHPQQRDAIRRQYRAALLAVGLPALLERVETAEGELATVIADAVAGLDTQSRQHGEQVQRLHDDLAISRQARSDQEEFIAGVRAKLSHTEAERDDAINALSLEVQRSKYWQAERDALAAKVAAASKLADWYDAQPNWREWRIGASIRTALDASETP